MNGREKASRQRWPLNLTTRQRLKPSFIVFICRDVFHSLSLSFVSRWTRLTFGENSCQSWRNHGRGLGQHVDFESTFRCDVVRSNHAIPSENLPNCGESLVSCFSIAFILCVDILVNFFSNFCSIHVYSLVINVTMSRTPITDNSAGLDNISCESWWIYIYIYTCPRLIILVDWFWRHKSVFSEDDYQHNCWW